MPEDTDTGAEEAQDNSGVITALRKKVRDLEKAVSDNDPSVVEAKVRESVARESAAAVLLDKAGHPKLSATFLSAVEGEVTEESVAKFLTDLGLTAREPASEDASSEGGNAEGGDGSPDPKAVAEVAAAGSDLAAATQSDGKVDPLAKISEATSTEELTALAIAGGYHQG